MILGFIKKVARNVHILCKKNSNMAQRIGCSRSFTDFKNEMEIFHDTLPKVINSIAASPQLSEIPEFADTIKQILDYNLTGGKCTRGVSTILTYKFLEKPEKVTEESLEISRVLGWCVEMFQAYWIILDDITDQSVTRRGKTCWHMLPDVGTRAVNDSALIYGIMLTFLKRNFAHLPNFPKIMTQFDKALVYTAAGQHLDYKMKNQKEKDYIQFSDEFYDTIAKYKTSYYTHGLPVYLGMILSNIDDMEILNKVEEIGHKMGRLHQMQNDIADNFALESETGKLGTDIQEGKCSWLAVTALQNCNKEQWKTFTTYYGSPNPLHVKEIKTLYDQLKLPEIYREERCMRYDEITRLARDFDSVSRAPELFLVLLEAFLGKK